MTSASRTPSLGCPVAGAKEQDQTPGGIPLPRDRHASRHDPVPGTKRQIATTQGKPADRHVQHRSALHGLASKDVG